MSRMLSFAIAASVIVSGAIAGTRAEPQHPSTTQATSQATFEVTIDTTAAPELAPLGEQVKTLAEAWYPKIAAALSSDGFTPPDHVTLVFDPRYNGVAATAGDRIVCSTKYFAAHPDDLGAFVHELVHVVQHYRDGDRPGWLTEGIADYVRFYQYEPESKRPRPDPTKAKYSDSYRTTAAFLDWAQRTFDPELVIKLNDACRNAHYSDALWKQYTGKTIDELGEAWKTSLQRR